MIHHLSFIFSSNNIKTTISNPPKPKKKKARVEFEFIMVRHSHDAKTRDEICLYQTPTKILVALDSLSLKTRSPSSRVESPGT